MALSMTSQGRAGDGDIVSDSEFDGTRWSSYRARGTGGKSEKVDDRQSAMSLVFSMLLSVSVAYCGANVVVMIHPAPRILDLKAQLVDAGSINTNNGIYRFWSSASG